MSRNNHYPYYQPIPSLADGFAKAHSIDKVIDRVHLVASNINEMTHVASDNIEKVGDQASTTLSAFNNHFSIIGTEFNKIIVLSRQKSSSIPLVLLYIGLVCGGIAIFLALLQFSAMAFHKVFQTYKYKFAVFNEEGKGVVKQRLNFKHPEDADIRV